MAKITTKAMFVITMNATNIAFSAVKFAVMTTRKRAGEASPGVTGSTPVGSGSGRKTGGPERPA
jgi:hypothetical protein